MKINFIKAVEYLKLNGYLEFGIIIPLEVIERLLNIPSSDEMEFIGPLLFLKEKIEEEGFLCTRSGCKCGELKILDAFEMAIKCDKITKNILRKQKRTINSMTKADVSALDESEKANINMPQIR